MATFYLEEARAARARPALELPRRLLDVHVVHRLDGADALAQRAQLRHEQREHLPDHRYIIVTLSLHYEQREHMPDGYTYCGYTYYGDTYYEQRAWAPARWRGCARARPL